MPAMKYGYNVDGDVTFNPRLPFCNSSIFKEMYGYVPPICFLFYWSVLLIEYNFEDDISIFNLQLMLVTG